MHRVFLRVLACARGVASHSKFAFLSACCFRLVFVLFGDSQLPTAPAHSPRTELQHNTLGLTEPQHARSRFRAALIRPAVATHVATTSSHHRAENAAHRPSNSP